MAFVATRRIGGEDPYASMLLRHYLDDRDPADVFNIDSRSYLRCVPDVVRRYGIIGAFFLANSRHGWARTVFYTLVEARQAIARYIDAFYNPVRCHSALDTSARRSSNEPRHAD